jgi:recombinational DNA repair protein RecR
MNCTFHSDKAATHWREGVSKQRLYMCRDCAGTAENNLDVEVHELEPPSEHCEVCGVHTGGGRCTFCDDLRDKELSCN